MRIAVLAYVCEPGLGSEGSAGWTWARMLARLGDVDVVTRPRYRAAIEGRLAEVPERDRLRFVFVDLPAVARFWERGQWSTNVHYFFWQVAALRELRRLRADVVWHVTFANAWLGSLAALAGGRFVFGPVGGGVSPCWRLVSSLGLRGLCYELGWSAVRAACRYGNPFARLAWRRASLILVQNPQTRDWLPSGARAKAEVFPNPVLETLASRAREREAGTTALFAGRLVAWKGASLAVRAVAQAPPWRLIVCGAGPDEKRLVRLARRLGVEDRVDVRGWLPRDRLFALMRSEADLLLFPSLHDEAGWIVVEALAAGLPVVCLDRGGPPLLAGPAARSVVAGRPAETVAGLAAALAAERAPPDVIEVRAQDFRLEARAERLSAVLADRRVLAP